MKSGLKYLIMLFLFVGINSTELSGSECSRLFVENHIPFLSEKIIPDAGEDTIDLPAILFHNILAGDSNASSHSIKVHTHLLCNIKEHKKTLFYSSSLHQYIIEDIYILPPKYYIYTLEKIVI